MNTPGCFAERNQPNVYRVAVRNGVVVGILPGFPNAPVIAWAFEVNTRWDEADLECFT